MEKFNLFNDDADTKQEEIKYSIEQAKFITDFKNRIKEEGVVCRNDILSLESLLEETVVTEEIPINNFTELRTQTGVEKIVNHLEGIKLPISVTPILTKETVISLYEQILERAIALKVLTDPNRIAANIKNLYNEIHTYGYRNYEGENKTDIYDVNDDDIYNHLSWNFEFKKHYFMSHNVDQFDRSISDESGRHKQMAMLPLLYVMKEDNFENIIVTLKWYDVKQVVNFNIVKVTQRDIVEALSSGTLHNAMEKIIEQIKHDIENYKRGYRNIDSVEDLKNKVITLKTIKNIICDEISYNIIAMYRYIKTSSLEG